MVCLLAGRSPVSEVSMIFRLMFVAELYRETSVEVFVFSPDFLLSRSLAECILSASETSLGARALKTGRDPQGVSAFASVHKSRELLYPTDIDRYGDCG